MSTVLQPDRTITCNGVKVNQYLLTLHNPFHIDMPTAQMNKVIGVTIHNTDWISVIQGSTPAEQYTRATVNGNMNDVRVHYYVDDKCAWQNLPLNRAGWHAADGKGDGNRKTIAIECIMSPNYNGIDQASELNAARLAAYLLHEYNLDINHLYTHTHWLNVKDGKRGDVDFLNTDHNYYKQCLPTESTELLTPYGWQKLKDIHVDDIVMQYNPDKDKLEFTNVLNVVEPYMSDILCKRYIEATPNHRMYVKPTQRGPYKDMLWEEVLKTTRCEILTNGYFETDGVPLSDDELRLLVWIQGDGHYMRNYKSGLVTGVEFHLKKERKIKRILEILNRLGIKYSESLSCDADHIRIYGLGLYAFAETWLCDKVFTYDLLKMNQSQFEVFYEELLIVDGHNGYNKLYTSSISENIDFVQALAVTHGMQATAMTLGSSRKFYGDRPIAVSFGQSGSYGIGTVTRDRTVEGYTEVSCVTVDSGYILIRQNKHTFIVGNCPLYILPHWNDFKEKVQDYLNELNNGNEIEHSDELVYLKKGTPIFPNAGANTRMSGIIKTSCKYTIVEKRSAYGVNWGRLKSNKGWVKLK